MGIDQKQQKKHPVTGIIGFNVKAESTKGRPKVDRETKKRISLAVLPSLYEEVGKIAYIDRISISELVSNCLESYVKENSKKIDEYNKLKGM